MSWGGQFGDAMNIENGLMWSMSGPLNDPETGAWIDHLTKDPGIDFKEIRGTGFPGHFTHENGGPKTAVSDSPLRAISSISCAAS